MQNNSKNFNTEDVNQDSRKTPYTERTYSPNKLTPEKSQVASDNKVKNLAAIEDDEPEEEFENVRYDINKKKNYELNLSKDQLSELLSQVKKFFKELFGWNINKK